MMALYGIALMPLAELLMKGAPTVLKLWNTTNAAMKGKVGKVAKAFKLLMRIGPIFGYDPEPEKLWVIYLLVTDVRANAAFKADCLPV